ncbi:TylF/MycF/NovP-related O-methyltransferase [Foetidibacter luteolus]|uniref:TylF/MycF/NovP-related O-methyltransferase n=1 Tax=Foetidibacter luteolus TaxID=2608880 RepID=UPI00129AC0CC|nr:TylF/MycF/NovP-related O-methyltransferase [Foetidibacter luteolus]
MLKKIFLRWLRAKGYKLQSYTKDDLLMKSFEEVYLRYKSYTMITPNNYKVNLLLCKNLVDSVDGDIVECGSWKGGMMAGISSVLGRKRMYYLFDSFEGLPAAKQVDGEAAIRWQNDKNSELYLNNCTADEIEAREAMQKAEVPHEVIKGWFNDTVSSFRSTNKIALLRLDGDWYESTLTCLQALYPKVVKGGLVIIDDYYSWDGCSRAVHDYFSSIGSSIKIRSLKGVCYIQKTEEFGNVPA